MNHNTQYTDTVEQCVDLVLSTVGREIHLGLPLGLGKPPEFVNALYQRAKSDPSIDLSIYTALSLEVPDPGKGLQKALLEPFFQRVFGNYPGLDYMRDLRKGEVPPNIHIHEFFFKSGSMLDNNLAQQNYICTNYTHAPRDILAHGVNVLAQTIAHRNRNGEDQYSLSCNPETTLDILPAVMERKARGEKIMIIGQVNEHLPFMVNDAQVGADIFDAIINNKSYYSTLFAPPKMPVSTTDYMIGLNTSALIADGGTLQIGIGSLGDAIVYGLQIRHENNEAYRAIINDLKLPETAGDLIQSEGGLDAFETGLYGNSEMFVDGFFTLIKSGILKRKVYEHEALQRLINEGKIGEQLRPDTLDVLMQEHVIHSRLRREDVAFLNYFGILAPAVTLQHHEIVTADGQRFSWDIHDDTNRHALAKACLGKQLCHGRIMHGGFFLGPREFYEGLKHLDEATLEAINMTNISYVNQLYGGEGVKRQQRLKSRFINTVFLCHLLGGATSDGLESGKVVSGVGGQYNFVAQAHELVGGRSILMLKSTREKNGHTQSNIVWGYGHTTIPRHLRDIYITEYGIADVRGKCDREVITTLLNVTDSRFQPELLRKAKQEGKVPTEYEIPERFRHNTPERLEQVAAKYRSQGLLPAFPCGTDFTVEELVLARTLKTIKAKTESKAVVVGALIKTLREGNKPIAEKFQPYLERINLTTPKSLEDRIARTLLLEELETTLE